ncbi:hypothetical protein PALA111701_01630 [Paenibacillus lactis]
MKIKYFYLLVAFMLTVFCVCYLYTVHKDLQPNLSGSIGPIKIQMSTLTTTDQRTGQESPP